MTRLRFLSRRLRADRSGVAMIEFALTLPLLVTAGFYGGETANLAMTNMRISQTALQIADNASRIGDTSTLQNRKIYEADINDVLVGGEIEAGDRADLYEHGRVIVSSLEVVDGTLDQQYIHWQRCNGKLKVDSKYGKEGTGLSGSFDGMGPEGEEITASPGEAVIFVEVVYEYQPLITDSFFGANKQIRAVAAFNVRDSRDLSQIYQRDSGSPEPISDCTKYEGSKIDLG